MPVFILSLGKTCTRDSPSRRPFVEGVRPDMAGWTSGLLLHKATQLLLATSPPYIIGTNDPPYKDQQPNIASAVRVTYFFSWHTSERGAGYVRL